MANRMGLPLLVCLPVLLSGFFAFDRYWAYCESRLMIEQRETSLEVGHRLANAHPDYWKSEVSMAPAELKNLVQQAGLRSGMRIVFLTELTKEAGNEVQERNVMARLIDVEHEPLVRFLSELEKSSQGVKVKELRLKPSKQKVGAYQDVELVVSTLASKA